MGIGEKTFLVPLIAGIGVIIITVAIILIARLLVKKRVAQYKLKDSLLTPTEIEYYNVLETCFGNEYRILPQINLASVIDKIGEGFRNELFRNVDFGIFDDAFRPILLIEINDNTHTRKDRIKRDEKVNLIAKRARIPLITFWTRDGIDGETIYKTVKKYL